MLKKKKKSKQYSKGRRISFRGVQYLFNIEYLNRNSHMFSKWSFVNDRAYFFQLLITHATVSHHRVCTINSGNFHIHFSRSIPTNSDLREDKLPGRVSNSFIELNLTCRANERRFVNCVISDLNNTKNKK